MDIPSSHPWSRRQFLRGLAVAGGAGLLGFQARPAVAEPPPETTTIRIVFDPVAQSLCYGPQFVAEELLRVEGFSDVRYVKRSPVSDAEAVALGEADFGAAWAGDAVLRADRYDSIVTLSGMHIGCAEVIAGERVRAFRDLKGKKVAVNTLNAIEHIFFALQAAYIGMDPQRDIHWVERPYGEWGRLLAEGEVDAIILWPPGLQEFREKKIGHVILSMTTDRPWRQYFCCVVTAHRDFVQKYPVATKRALRAMLKAVDICALEPERAARSMVKTGFPYSYERALQVFREVPFSQWREYDPVDTVRFFALRLHEIGLIEHTPKALMARGAEWRFLNELKKELKA